MKTAVAIFSSALASLCPLVLPEPAGSATPASFTTQMFLDECASAALKGRSDYTTLQREDDFVSNHHSIRIYKLKRRVLIGSGLVVIIGNKDDSNSTDVPQFDVVCLNNAPFPSHTNVPGDIDFHFSPNVMVEIQFQLTHLDRTHWKQNLPDSIWMISYPEGATHGPPTAHNWPKCMSNGKQIDRISDRTIGLKFKMCPDKGKTHFAYQYTARVDTTQLDATVKPIDLDPFIFNRP